MLSPSEVSAFQRENRDWEGKLLLPDGDFGPRTQWAYAVSLIDAPRREALRRAASKVGLWENGDNRDPDIDAWLLRCGLEPGLPWCAAFASWVISVVGGPDVAIAGAMRLGRRFRILAPLEPAQAGDLFFFDTDGDAGDKGHIGPLLSDETEGEFLTCEGNHRNAVRLVRRLRKQGIVSRPFERATGPAIPLPRKRNGQHLFDLVHVAGVKGTR
jgi:hypothetical protein